MVQRIPDDSGKRAWERSSGADGRYRWARFSTLVSTLPWPFRGTFAALSRRFRGVSRILSSPCERSSSDFPSFSLRSGVYFFCRVNSSVSRESLLPLTWPG
eukprot:6187405-Pleurochrysis_carterae.AAC.1